MSKNLIVINGTAGIGKTALCQVLYQQLGRAVWLDGDWCWLMHPWQITTENKQMVEDNICYLLNNYLRNSSLQNIVFCWVLQRESIMQRLLQHLDLSDCAVFAFSLVCQPEVLQARLTGRGATLQQVAASVARLPAYWQQNTVKIDNTQLTIAETVQEVLRKIKDKNNVYRNY